MGGSGVSIWRGWMLLRVVLKRHIGRLLVLSTGMCLVAWVTGGAEGGEGLSLPT